MSVPVFPDLPALSQGSNTNRSRYEQLVLNFEAKYGRKPAFVARAPGRVNIIGEHIDYCGYGVLPMAIEQDVAIACALSDTPTIRFSNVEPSFPDYSCPAKDFAIGKETKPQWYLYLLCGHKGILEEARLENPRGMDLLVDGSIPPSSGLSSSSALVCCAALVTVYANKLDDLLDKKRLAELCAHAEHYIGTEGGGMDQAISFLAEPGKAKMIEFNPIRPSNVCLPAGTQFVISNCLVEANKAAFAAFNERVTECRLAAQVISKKSGLTGGWKKVRTLRALQDGLGQPLTAMLGVVEQHLHQHPYTREEVCQILEVTSEELEKESLNVVAKDMQSFKLHMRATHVFGEAGRVFAFKDKANCVAAGESGDLPVAVELGQLMNESHYSCSKLYECSCEELDRLVQLCVEGGALGSRLTGAGWGGCAVSLVAEGNVEGFISKVSREYYESDPTRRGKLATSLFATRPGPGAAICDLFGSGSGL